MLLSLNQSQSSHTKSQSLGASQGEKLSPMTRSYSMPKNSEFKMHRKNTGTENRPSPMVDMLSYKDACLSSAQDYVSGCSLITHTPLKSKSSSTSRTKGRASEHKLRFWSSAKLGKSNQDGGLSIDQSNFIRSSSFHGRSGRDEKINNLSSSRSFDNESRPKNLPLHQSDSRLKALSDPPNLVIPKSSSENLRSSTDDISSRIRNHSFSTYGKSASSSTLPDMTLDGDKTIRRLPDIIHESVTWNDITHQPDQPLYFSPATEPMTPLGNRHFKFGFTNQDEESGFDPEGSSIARRGVLQPPYMESDITISNDLNVAANQISIRVNDTQHPAIPISYNTWSSKSSDSDSLNRSGNFASSLQELNSTGRNSLRRHNEIPLASEAPSSSNTSISMIHPNEDGLEHEAQCKPHSDSILSGHSSICSDQERGSLCSLETCSCTSSEEPESTVHRHHHHHHRTKNSKPPKRHFHQRNGSLFDDRPK